MPSSKNYKRNYKQELVTEKQNHPERVKERAARNAARSFMESQGKVTKGDNKDVDHIKPLSEGGDNSKNNLRVRDSSTNRSFERDSDGSIKLII